MMRDCQKHNFLLVKYESLMENLQEEMDRIFDFIGVDSINIDLNQKINRKSLHNKFYRLSNSPDFNAMSMKKLSADDIRTIDQYATPMLELLGYK